MERLIEKKLLAHLNKAKSLSDLYDLGLSQSKAKAILRVRKQKNKFNNILEIIQIEGIGERTLARLEKVIMLSSQEKSLALDKELQIALMHKDSGHQSDCLRACSVAIKIAKEAGNEAEINYAKAMKELYAGSLGESQRLIDLAICADKTKAEEYRRAIHLIEKSVVSGQQYLFLEALNNVENGLDILRDLYESFTIKQNISERSSQWWVAYFLWLGFHRKANFLFRMYRYTEAVDCCDRAVKIGKLIYDINPAFNYHNSTLNNKAIFLWYLGRYAETQDLLTELVKHGDDKATYLNNLGFLYIIENNIDDALGCLQHGLTIAKKRGDNTGYLNYNLGLVYKRKAQASHTALAVQEYFQMADKCFVLAYDGLRDSGDLLRSLTADYTAEFLKAGLPQQEGLGALPNKKDREFLVAREVLLELLGEIDNFVTDGAGRLDLYTEFLKRGKTLNQVQKNLYVLRRWNSFTPRVPLPMQISSKGGGYFLSWHGYGIVIDPGFDFIENFSEVGLALSDINAILITHAHIDHTAELEALITLLAERKEREPSSHQVALGLSIGTLNKVNIGWFLRETTIINPILPLVPGQEIELNADVRLQVLNAEHNDIASERTAVGLKISSNSDDTQSIVFSGDTAYTLAIAKQYEGCGILVLHLGSTSFAELAAYANYSISKTAKHDIFDEKHRKFDISRHLAHIERVLNYRSYEKFKKMLTGQITEKDKESLHSDQHLTFHGVFSVINGLSVPPKLIILSEFGEELGANRFKIAKVLNKHLAQGTFGRDKRDLRCVTGDVNLDVIFATTGPKIRCEKCRRYVTYKSIIETCVWQQHLAISHLCPRCAKKRS